MEGIINMLFLRDLKNCEIHTCPVSNSVMGHFLTGCTMSLIGHQIRLHDSYDNHFSVYTTSKLIIEDCSRLKFHELQYTYDRLHEDIKESGLSGHNFWKEVQDFKWIKKERSPNFCLVFDGREQAPEINDATPVFNLAPKVKQETVAAPTVGVTAMASNVNNAHFHPGHQDEKPVDRPEPVNEMPQPAQVDLQKPVTQAQPQTEPQAKIEPATKVDDPAPAAEKETPVQADVKHDSDEEIDEL